MNPKDLRSICLIIDLDGFQIKYPEKKFYVREFGYASLTKNYVDSFRFNLTKYYKSLSEVDRKSVWYSTYLVHGLPFKPWKEDPEEKDTQPHTELNDIILKIYNNHKTFDKKIVAYKGGNYEKDILKKLHIPHLNLEAYGCPKFENLPTPEINDCGFHLSMDKAHCPKVECAAFAEWTRKKMQEAY